MKKKILYGAFTALTLISTILYCIENAHNKIEIINVFFLAFANQFIIILFLRNIYKIYLSVGWRVIYRLPRPALRILAFGGIIIQLMAGYLDTTLHYFIK